MRYTSSDNILNEIAFWIFMLCVTGAGIGGLIILILYCWEQFRPKGG